MNAANAVAIGNLVSNVQFFGSSTAEIASTSNVNYGGWNGDRSSSVNEALPFSGRGARSNLGGTSNGIFAFDDEPASIYYYSHRTILSGY